MSKVTPARVRFAPSPTGFLHVGSIRSGLFNWLWARHTGGVSVLRIEDTDRARLVEGAIDQINDSMEALGIAPDEGPRQGGDFGPYIQSERTSSYNNAALKLVGTGALYPCWCSPERLTELREAAQKSGTAFKYDRHCLIPKNQGSPDKPHVLRFRIPDEPESIGWDDAVRGRLEFKLADLDDFVAIKTDGFPTYQFANVVDDHLMEITHVLRADEWIASTPKHLLLFAAFGWEPPTYAHLPAVQGPDGTKKLSKRDGAQSVQEYIEEGYLPEALMSFLASLGWNDGTEQEIYTRDELIEKFSLDRVQKSPAKFDKDRLTWINGVLIRQMGLEELDKRAAGFWPTSAAKSTPAYRQSVLKLVQERLKYLAELPQLTEFFFNAPELSRALFEAKDNVSIEKAAICLQTALDALSATPDTDFAAEKLEAEFRGPVFAKLQEHTQIEKLGPFFMTLRVALTSQTATPGLFEMMETLGKTTVLERLLGAQKLLEGTSKTS